MSFARSWWVKVLLLTLVGLGVRIGYVAAYQRCDPVTEKSCTGPKLSGDGAYYHNAANLLADGKGFIDPFRYLQGGRDVVDVEMADGTLAPREVITPVGHTEPTAGHPPVWVLLLGTASFLGLRSVLAHQLVAAFVGAAAIPLFALVGKRLVGPRTGLIAAGLAAIYTMLWINDGLVMSETAVVLVVPLIMLAALRFRASPTVANGVIVGAAGALGALTRAEIALFLPIFAAVVLLRSRLAWSRRALLYAVCGVSALAVVSPWVIRNMTAFQNSVYLSNGAGTVWVQANCDAVYYGPDIGYWNYNCGSPMPYGPNGELLDESERDVVVRERAIDYIKDHKTRLVTAVIPARIGRMFSVVQPIRQLDLEVLFEDRPYALSALGLAEYYVLAALAAVGTVALWRRRLPVLPIVLWIGLVAFTAAFAFGNMRYRVTAEPALVVLAAVGIDAIWCRFRGRSAATAGAEVSGGSDGSGGIDAHPIVPPEARELTPLHRGWAWLTATTPRRGAPWRAAFGRGAAASAPADHVPTGRGAPLPHLPALDGLRGIAVIGVLLFHAGFGFMKGGFLGVSAFFTLSGFLITNLLVREFDRDRGIDLRTFWARRFRRLMPAALMGLVVIAGYGSAFASPEQLQRLRGDMVAALLYAANWRFFFTGQSYGQLFSAPSPVQHYWSLAIEEQFYFVFPVVVLLVLRAGGRRWLWAVLGAAAAASLAACVALAGHPDQVYYGTHTRAFELLAGALLALWWSGRRTTAPRERVRLRLGDRTRHVLLAGAGFGALALMLVSWTRAHEDSIRLARGGLAAHALVVVVLIYAATRRGPVATVLAFPPLRWLGLISYGVYVYHWPIFLVLSPERTGLSTTPLFALRMIVTLAAALLSYHLLEQPIRRARRLRRPALALGAAPVGALLVLAAAVGVTLNPPPSTIAYANVQVGTWAPTIDEVPAGAAPGSESAGPAGNGASVAGSTEQASGQADDRVPARVARTVLIVGDSSMVDTAPALGAAFKAAGATTIIDAAAPGFGLTRPETPYHDAWAGLVRDRRPDLVVVMLGGWDLNFLRDRGDAAYAGVVDDAIGVLSAGGARVLWLSMAPGGTTPDRQVDRVYSTMPARHPGVVDYWDFESVLRGPAGDWPRSVTGLDGETVLLRKPDDFHMCPEGAARVAQSALDRAVTLGWTQPAAGDWRTGDWRTSPRYDDPHGGCVVRR